MICFNNDIYSMTGGQYSPTTPTGDKATTAPYGNLDRPFDIAQLAAGAGASFAARGDVYHARETTAIIKQAMLHKGFSLVDVYSVCPTYYGRKNKKGDAVEMLKWQRDNLIPLPRFNMMPPEEMAGKKAIGVLAENDFPEYSEEYQKLIDRFAAKQDGEGRDMNERSEMRFAGSGGQGVILASVIMAEAAVIAGLNTVQSQAYGPEARGGVSKAETVLSRDRIWYSKVTHPNFLLALTQASLDKYTREMAEGAVVMADESLSVPADLDPARVISIPILRTAKEKVGKAFTANIVAVGAINAALRLFSDEELMEGVKRHIPAGTEEINQKALAEGAALISAAQAEAFAQKLG